MLKFESPKAILTLRPVGSNLAATIKSPKGTLLSQGFIYPNQYHHLTGLFHRYFSATKTEEIMKEIVGFFV